jgi:alpha-tubulin suppressor-like RCC1 family protein
MHLGDGTSTQRLSPGPVSGLGSGVTDIDGGWGHGLAVKSGALYVWGNTIGTATPVLFPSLTSGVTDVTAGAYFSLVVKNGGLFAFGLNENGQLGDGTKMERFPTPVSVIGMSTGVTKVDAGEHFSFAIKDGAAYAWGDNGAGQLGDGTSAQRTSPVPIVGLSDGVTDIAAGSINGIAARNGHVYVWGPNYNQQLAPRQLSFISLRRW